MGSYCSRMLDSSFHIIPIPDPVWCTLICRVRMACLDRPCGSSHQGEQGGLAGWPGMRLSSMTSMVVDVQVVLLEGVHRVVGDLHQPGVIQELPCV